MAYMEINKLSCFVNNTIKIKLYWDYQTVKLSLFNEQLMAELRKQ